MSQALAKPTVLHMLLVFALVAALAAQSVLIRPGLSARDLRLAATIDPIYGVCAMLLFAAGFGRVFLGAKGAQVYLDNPLFWSQIALVLLLAILPIPPTVRLIRWSRRARKQAGHLPAEDQLRATRQWLFAEGVVFALIPVAAAAMARGAGFG